ESPYLHSPYQVSIVATDLHHEDTIIQAAQSLDCLHKTINSIFERIDARLARNGSKVEDISKRVKRAQAKINALRAIQIFAPARFPASDVLAPLPATFPQVVDDPLMEEQVELEQQPRRRYSSHSPSDQKQEDADVFFHVRGDREHESPLMTNRTAGLGALPLAGVKSVPSLMRFNTNEFAYGDDLNAWKRSLPPQSARRVASMSARPTAEKLLAPAPHSLAHGTTKLATPADLPDLPGIANDLQYEPVEEQTPIAPSQQFGDLPELPDLGLEEQEITVQAIAAQTHIPGPSRKTGLGQCPSPVQRIPSPPPFPTKGAVKPLSPSISTPLNMPKPPAPTEDPRSELMAAIRNAGGVHGGRLRSPAAAPLDVAGAATTGNLMADLHNKLMLRRKGISGSQNPGEATAGNPLMQQLSRVIPPPVQPRKGSQSSVEERSEEDEDKSPTLRIMTTASRDINDLFDDIVLTEEKEARLGYEEGLKDGQEQGNEEGYKLGYAQGVSLGEELGRILGQVVAQQQLKHTDKWDLCRTSDPPTVDSAPYWDPIKFPEQRHLNLLLLNARITVSSSMSKVGVPQLQKRLDGLLAFLNPHWDFVNCHMALRREISGKEDVDLAIDGLFWQDDEAGGRFPEWLGFLKKGKQERLALHPELLTSVEELIEGQENAAQLSIREFMSAKKCHEVELTAALVDHLLKNSSQDCYIVDAGDGKGYLSSRLALQYGHRVLGIDANAENTQNALSRNRKLQRAWNGLTERAELQSQGITPKRRGKKSPTRDTIKSAPALENYKTTARFITTELNFGTLLAEHFHQLPQTGSPNICLTGLHTYCQLLCNIGCCYHLLKERYSQQEFFGNKALMDMQTDHGFPLSQYLQERQVRMGRNARMLAAQSIERTLDAKELPNEYIQKCATKLDAPWLAAIEEEELHCLLQEYALDKHYLDLFYLLRMSFAPVLESLILLDRLLYLKELGYERSYLIDLFDPMVLTEALFVVVAALVAVYMWFQRNHSYWQRKGIPYIPPTPIIGNTKVVFKMENSFGMHLSEIYNDPRVKDEAVVGIYSLNKPELIKSVLIKDFNRFHNRYARCDPHRDPLGYNNLFFVRDTHWKDIRTKLTPVFTSGKVKQMYTLMQEIGSDLEAALKRHGEKSSGKYITEIKEICAQFSTDSIATIAFGIRANSLQNPNAEFRNFGRKLFTFTISRAKDFFVSFFLPKLFFTPDFSRFMRSTIGHVMEERERTGFIRNDLIDVLVGLRKEAAAEPSKPHYAKNNDFLVAQAGMAKHPEMQQRLRQEINEALVEGGGTLSYEKIQSLEYLSMVVDEVLRMYPVLPFLDREYESVKGQPDLSLKPFYDYTFENGTPYWTNPSQFDPERFSPENRKSIVAMAYQPFGSGPHNCIGSRIGLLQSKLGLVSLLKNHSVRSCAATMKEMKFDPKGFVLQAEAAGGEEQHGLGHQDVAFEHELILDARSLRLLCAASELDEDVDQIVALLSGLLPLRHHVVDGLAQKSCGLRRNHLEAEEGHQETELEDGSPMPPELPIGIRETICFYSVRHSGYHIRGVQGTQLLGLQVEAAYALIVQRLLAKMGIQAGAHLLDQREHVVGFFVFQTPALMVRDPELIRQVLVKNFNSFLNRYESADVEDTMGALTLPLAKYHHWKESRQCMSQLFTSGRMREIIYPQILNSYLNRKLRSHPSRVLPLGRMCQLYTTDVTGNLFYSLDVGGLRRGRSQLLKKTKELFNTNFRKVLDFMIVFFLPKWTSLLRPKISRSSDHYSQHPDFIASQAGIILLAGFETSSALMGFTLYELAKAPGIQERLRRELCEAFGSTSTLSYETLNALPYLKMALRLYPAAAFVNRECTSSEPEGVSLQPHVDFVVPPGMPAYISILGLHRDEKYWPEPYRFDPERFAPERTKDIHPMTYIPFGAGPHGCIGNRLGILQLKLGIAHILKLYWVEVCERTVAEIRFNPKSFMLKSQDEIYLRFCRDNL
ncbi:hypothetical protein M5D96_008264, partial [Drosophila gunungcola]